MNCKVGGGIRTLISYRIKLSTSARHLAIPRSKMAPQTPIPYPQERFSDVDEYVDSLLNFASTSRLLQTLCGGVHILDFFIREPSLYHTVVPEEWRSWLLECPTMALLDLLMRDDLDAPREDNPPESLISYIRDIRKHSLRRSFFQDEARKKDIPKLPRHISVGMIPKKIHEVTNFADYVVRVSDDISTRTGNGITHFVDFGSGQNYLGRTLASPPYNKQIVAVESKELNIKGARRMDVSAGVAEREKVMRNKKLYRLAQNSLLPEERRREGKIGRLVKQQAQTPQPDIEFDFRPTEELDSIYTPEEGKGHIQYVEHVVKDGDLSDVVEQIEKMNINTHSNGSDTSPPPDDSNIIPKTEKKIDPRLMAISIHSCGNLSHHGIRSLLLNPSVKAVAIVGCCYNLLTERLAPPSYKHPLLRPNLQAINAPSSNQTSNPADPHGFPMSERIATHNNNESIHLNITARMMAVQAPSNWTPGDSESFFKRHFYRALLQRLFLDYGVVSKINLSPDGTDGEGMETTEAIIIGSLRKACYASFLSYVRGAISKMEADTARGSTVAAKMKDITDEEILGYEERYGELRKELSVVWSLMAFSAGVVESLIVTDRWLFLREQRDVVRECWVESVFEYGLSPRNLVVVGVKD
ncbi:methyltransferase domain-containing protein [Xylogone sp. PMI_703]|nr:methyltransferase domain-containing protein [Xylogone sp. PMI_703]